MFGWDWRIAEVFPHYFLDYRQQISSAQRWQNRVVSQGGDWSGNVYDFYYRVYNLMSQALKLPFKLEGVHRVDDTPAHRALREALANCLTNANYFERRGVVCLWEPDVLRISNPGDFRMDIREALRGGESDPRNENMLRMFSYVNVGERAGSGLPIIMNGWKACGYAEPYWVEAVGPDRTTLVLPLASGGSSGSDLERPTVGTGDEDGAEGPSETAGNRRKPSKTVENRRKPSEIETRSLGICQARARRRDARSPMRSG